MLDAARELFAERGYEETTTRQIADRAGVLEHLLYRNFGSKAGLFDAAVVGPLSELVADYARSWDRDRGSSTPEERISAFVSGLYELASANRTLLLAALARGPSHRNGTDDVLDHMAKTLHDLESINAIGNYPDLDPPATMAAVAGMIFGVALLPDMLFPQELRRPSQERLTKEMTKFIVSRLDTSVAVPPKP
jgi:AcrR family transcriptional regulator